MATDKHVRAVAAEVAVQDAELLDEFANRAKWGQGDYAVAYAVLRFGQTVTRLVAAACQDDAERAERVAEQQPLDAGAEATSPAPAAPVPEPEVIEASASGKGKRRTRPTTGT